MGIVRTICGNVNQEDITLRTKFGEITSSLNVELASAFGVFVDFVRKAVGRAWIDVMSV